jgi:ABC-type transport system substrate-binding protein
MSGGKIIHFDRIEWIIMPDPATASAALQSGEIDWWESPLPDLIPLLRRNRNVEVDIADPLGNIGAFRLNHLHPPFDNVKVRRAVQMAISACVAEARSMTATADVGALTRWDGTCRIDCIAPPAPAIAARGPHPPRSRYAVLPCPGPEVSYPDAYPDRRR